MKVGHSGADQNRVLMLLSNPFLPDPRVLKEACSLSRSHEVTVWALDPDGQFPRYEEVEGVRIHRIRLTFLRRLRPIMLKLHVTLLADAAMFYLKSLQLLLRDFQIVHSHDLPPLLLAVFLGKLKRAKIIFDAHEDFAAQIGFQWGHLMVKLLLELERLLMRHVDSVIVVGEIMKEEYRKRTKKPIHVVGNWNDSEEFRRTSLKLIASSARKARYEDKLIVSYLSGINPNRIVFPLLEAAREDPGIFVIVAGGRDGDQLAAEVEGTMKTLSNGLYLGWLNQKELNAYFSYSDVIYYCLHPADPNNRYYAGNTVFSALAAGKAIITTAIGEASHIVKKGNCGIVMREASKEDILEAFAKLKGREYLRVLQENALQKSRLYSWSRAEKALLELYGKLSEQPSTPEILA